MALADRVLTLKLVADVGDINKGVNKAQGKLKGFASSAASWTKAAGIGLAIEGVSKLGDALGDAVEGFRSGQRVAAQLGVTWRRMGIRGTSLQKTIDKISKRTLALGTSDDEAIQTFNTLIQTTGSVGKAMQRLKIAQDLVANGSAPNLAAAAKLIQGAYTGSAKVVDKFGLTAKTASGRVNELGNRVKGAANKAASLNPFGRLINTVQEGLEGIVGAFTTGDVRKVLAAFGELGKGISDALFGRTGTGPHHKHVQGIVEMAGGLAQAFATSIATEFGKVDWVQTISDTLNTAAGAVAEAAGNNTLQNLAILGGALAAAIFAVQIFTTALITMLSLPAWAAKGALASAIWLVGHGIGVAIAGAAFTADLFLTALTTMLTTFTLSEAAIAAAGALGVAIAAAVILGFGPALADALAQKIRDILGVDIPLGPGDLPWKHDGKAKGGRVTRGMPYVVGEKGAELFVPGQSGTIIPHGAGGSGGGWGGGGVTININAGVGDPVSIGREVRRVLDAYQLRAGA